MQPINMTMIYYWDKKLKKRLQVLEVDKKFEKLIKNIDLMSVAQRMHFILDVFQMTIYIYIYIYKLIYKNCRKKKKKSSFASNKVFIRWWPWVQAWFRGRSIITTNPWRPSSISQYYQILLDGVWSVRMPYPFRCSYSLFLDLFFLYSFFFAGESPSLVKNVEVEFKIKPHRISWGNMSVDQPFLIQYIYIYILSSTDRLFRYITTLRCGKTRRTLGAGIETCPTLR